eukprot:TRINITY_DN14889_c0_g2_i1.p1 TRINITY_DN14889_c0_g2~~TRINITY_DN14889_c0_g2_i1.p1  ORF type:complete len:879 (-),score=199.42 TRINITY_DN14889_c0_g2_i1:50-2686(-)
MAGLAVAAAGAYTVWEYNRSNYDYDREMRLKQEQKILQWRNVHAELWREDIEDIIGLTEKKMGAYLFIGVLMVRLCVALITEGRLEPGTPHWLMHFYLLSLAAGFLYLLMSVWFAMHAIVVSQSSSARLLTQFVRLKIPTVEQLQDMRTYLQSYEKLPPGKVLRIPFLHRLVGRRGGTASSSVSASASATGGAFGGAADPWGLEAGADEREDLYELITQPVALRRHSQLAKKASLQFQCYDAFSRVSMTFGVNQVLRAIAYYIAGYVAVQDNVWLPALSAEALLASIGVAILNLDLSMTRAEQLTGHSLAILSYGSVAFLVVLWVIAGQGRDPNAEVAKVLLMPIAYAAHALWLGWALWTSDIRMQKNGAMLPGRFRAVLYMDVFGWIAPKSKASRGASASSSYGDAGSSEGPVRRGEVLSSTGEGNFRAGGSVREYSSRSFGTSGAGGPPDSGAAASSALGSAASPGAPAGDALHSGGMAGGYGDPCGEIREVPDDAFLPVSYMAEEDGQEVPVVTGHGTIQAGLLPARMFVAATLLLIAVWSVSMLEPLDGVRRVMFAPDAAEYVQELEDLEGTRDTLAAEVAVDAFGTKEILPMSPVGADDVSKFPFLFGMELLQAKWPDDLVLETYLPRRMSADQNGTHLAVSDDFTTFVGTFAGPGFRHIVFEHVPSRCDGRGQKLSDVGVRCDGQARSSCDVLFLFAHSGDLETCPLGGAALGKQRTWHLGGSWLHNVSGDPEQLTSAVVALDAEGHVGSRAFVGTSEGRILEMRRARGDERRFLPYRKVHSGQHAESAMSLVFGSVVIVLDTSLNSVCAYGALNWILLGCWRLPPHYQWLQICGSNEYIYVIGREIAGSVLARFPMPPELLRASASLPIVM